MAAKSSATTGGGGIKYTPRRIYYPYARRQAAASTGDDFGRGWKVGQSIGGGMMDLAKAIAAARQQAIQNRVANRILNTAAPPRAAWVGGAVPKAGVSTVGTAPETGGTAALDEAIRGQQYLDQLQRSRIAGETMEMRRQAAAAGAGRGNTPWSGGGSASRGVQRGAQGGWNQQSAKATKYQPGSSTPDKPDYYDFGHMRADVDKDLGKGAYDGLVNATADLEPNPDKPGQLRVKGGADAGPNSGVKVSDNGDIILKNGTRIPSDRLPGLAARYDATGVKQGFKPVYTDWYLKTQNPQSNSAPGSVTNPYTPKDDLEANAIEPGSYFVNPKDGKTYQMPGGEQATTQQPATANVPPGHKELGPPATPAPAPAPAATTQVPTAAQAATPNIAAATTPQIPAQPVDLAAVTPSSTPDQFNLASGYTPPPSGGLPQDAQLADAIRQQQVAQALQGVT